jgi:cytochrome c peroxidase
MAQFWDGRAQTVEAQAMGPVLNPVEMAMPSEGHALTVLASIPGYVAAFRGAFPSDASPISAENFGKAIGAFERQLRTPCRWDRYLGGEGGALSRGERAGLKAFIDYSCQTCHNGALLGGNSFQKLGMIKPWPVTHDPGRFAITRIEADRFVFKVASLRNVTKTAPYFHDGSMPTLEGAVEKMAEHQLGKKIPRGDRDRIIRFLGALTGELQVDLIRPPNLPASGPSTPAPIR